MSKKAPKNKPVPSFPSAMARLVGSHLGVLALGATLAAGMLQGVTHSTALIRAVAMGFIFYFCGRIVGWFLGRSLEDMTTGDPFARSPETGSTKA
jgi:hypothetical protein